MNFIVCTLCALMCISSHVTGSGYEVMAQWKEMQYTNPDPDGFEPHNNILTGLKVMSADEIYVTVSRWLPGVPATLSKLDQDLTLDPYPSEGMNNYVGKNIGQFPPS